MNIEGKLVAVGVIFHDSPVVLPWLLYPLAVVTVQAILPTAVVVIDDWGCRY